MKMVGTLEFPQFLLIGSYNLQRTKILQSHGK